MVKSTTSIPVLLHTLKTFAPEQMVACSSTLLQRGHGPKGALKVLDKATFRNQALALLIQLFSELLVSLRDQPRVRAIAVVSK